MDIRRIFAELQRRHVGRVAGYYAVAGWVVIQVVATVFPLLGFSDSAAKIAVVLVALGFPIALALAWAFDITPDGVQRTEALSEGTAPLRGAHSYRRNAGFFGVGILVALVSFAALSRVREDSALRSAAGIRSIAVLPFVDMSQKHDQGAVTDGISEELLNRLAQIPDLKVSARTSSFAFRGQSLDISEIARRLKVEAVLEGSVRRDGNDVRINARLIDARTQNELWSNEYQKEFSSIFQIQDEIATDIVNALKLQIDGRQVSGGGADISAEPAAVEAYMQGLDALNQRTDASLRRATLLFETAVQKDTTFALAYAMLAQVYALLPAYGDFPTFEASTKGQAAAARALELNSSQPEAYAALGQIRQNFEWDFESAERSYRRAILFNNGYATAHQWRAEALLLLGNTVESRTEIDNALDLDPASAAALHVKAYQFITQHEYGPANRTLDRILAANPNYPLALISKTSVAIMTRQAPAARAVIARLTAGNPAFQQAVELTAAAALDKARRADAERAIAALEGRRSSSELALWYALAGSNQKALWAIETAYQSGADANLPFILLHPAFDGIRSNPDFQKILDELHMLSDPS